MLIVAGSFSKIRQQVLQKQSHWQSRTGYTPVEHWLALLLPHDLLLHVLYAHQAPTQPHTTRAPSAHLQALLPELWQHLLVEFLCILPAAEVSKVGEERKDNARVWARLQPQ
jgi:hypothetical protein